MAENRKHRTDAELVAFLDGELEAPARQSVSDHLDTCWHCRARSSAFRTSMELVARAADDSARRAPIDPDSAARLFDRMERQLRASEPAPAHRFPVLLLYAAPAAAVLLLLSTSIFLPWPVKRQHTAQPLSATVIRQQVEASEKDEGVPGAIRHQVYGLDLESVRPARIGMRHRVEIWSDGRRHSLTFKDREGTLRYAAWRTQDKFLTERTRFAMSRPARSRLGECVSAEEAEAFATAFLRRQPGGRLRLAAGLFRDLERSGFTLEREAVHFAGRIRLVARQQRGSFEDQAWLEVDPAHQTPIALGLSSESSSAAWKLVLRLEKEEAPLPSTVPADAFVPDAPARRVAVAALAVPEPPREPVQEDLDERELSAIAFTSRWRKPGERLRVDRLAGQGVFIGGSVAGEERKNEITRLLDAWPGLSFSVQSGAPARTTSWCTVASDQLVEAGEHARVMQRLQVQFSRPDLAPDLRSLRDRVAAEQAAGFAAAVEELDRLLRPIRGSAPAALVVVKGPEDALDKLAGSIQQGCGGDDNGLMPRLGVEARGRILGLIVALKEFHWTIRVPADPSVQK